MSSISSIVSMVTGAISAITGIISIFQQAHTNTLLTRIEESTRYVKIWTGEQSQNILWCVQKTVEYLGYVIGDLDALKTSIWLIQPAVLGIGDQLTKMTLSLGYTVTDLDDIKVHMWQLVALGQTPLTANVGGTDLSLLQQGLVNINNTLQFDVGLGPWERTALQNINNGIVACAGWLQGIANMPALHGAIGGGSNADLAKFVGAEFTTLEQWIQSAFGRTFPMPALPTPPPMPTSLSGGSMPSTSIPSVGTTATFNASTNSGVTIPITVNGNVVGSGGMRQLSDMVGNVVIDRLRQNGMKY